MSNVTQADRDAAFATLNRHQQVQLDHSYLARAFAAHRIATIEECAKEAKALGEIGCTETKSYASWFEHAILSLKGPTNDQA